MSYMEDFHIALKAVKDRDLPTALNWYSKILFEHPEFTPAWNQRGLALLELGHPFDAILNFNRAIVLEPKEAASWINRGTAYLNAEYYEKSLEDFAHAEKLDPKQPVIPQNMGNTLYRLCRIDEAIERYRRGIKVDPTHSDSHLGLAFSLLKSGQFEEGWHEFEWRWKNGQLPPRGLSYPKWDGDRAMLKTDVLLIYAEQGLGDTLQFCRLAPLAKSLWRGKIILEVPHPLTRLMGTLDGIDGIVTLGEQLPRSIAACVPMMSLPRLLGIKYLEDIPNQVPYLKADPYRISVWGDYLKQLPPGMLVGICWAGKNRDSNPAASSIDARRSMQLNDFDRMAKIPGISWVSLQLGPPRDQVKSPPKGMFIGDWGDYLYDFFDTAALIEALDLVITVDTSVAHVAGALGKPVWLLSRFDACWRWLMDRTDSPWYPSMKLFTQEKPYSWGEPLVHMEMKLNEFRRNWEPKKAAA